MKKLRISRCREVKQSLPIPLSRHIVAPYAICKDLEGVDPSSIPNDIVETAREKGYAIINPQSAQQLLGLEIGEDEYIKIFLEDLVTNG
uniref:Uncharacterized protein n=1 Tax=Ignisphaera aggregans TaxID=334771 RepID=A0A7C2V9G1_9CREN